MSTINVPFQEHEESPIEAGGRGGDFAFTRIFCTAYADRFEFLTGLFTGGILGLPMIYSEAWPNLRADKFSIERITDNPQGLAYMTDPERQQTTHDSIAKITVDYAPLENDSNQDPLRDGTFASYNQGQVIEYNGVPSRAMQWESSGDPLPPDVQPVVPTTITRHEVTWSQVDNPPWSLIQSKKGFVNGSSFYIPASRQTVAAEGLLFTESSSRQTMTYAGDLSTELTLVFEEKNQVAFGGGSGYGWNHQWNPETQEFDRPLNEFGNTQFPATSFGEIFN